MAAISKQICSFARSAPRSYIRQVEVLFVPPCCYHKENFKDLGKAISSGACVWSLLHLPTPSQLEEVYVCVWGYSHMLTLGNIVSLRWHQRPSPLAAWFPELTEQSSLNSIMQFKAIGSPIGSQGWATYMMLKGWLNSYQDPQFIVCTSRFCVASIRSSSYQQ